MLMGAHRGFPGMHLASPRASSLPGEKGVALLPTTAKGCRQILAPELMDNIHSADIKLAPMHARDWAGPWGS